jgi:hypothetical protein
MADDSQPIASSSGADPYAHRRETSDGSIRRAVQAQLNGEAIQMVPLDRAGGDEKPKPDPFSDDQTGDTASSQNSPRNDVRPQDERLTGHERAFASVPRPLNWKDVAALIMNKMIGTGIYTNPPMVLLLTRSKGEALGLWFAGFVYTLIRYVSLSSQRQLTEYKLLSMVIYLEYARRLPHTGGELIFVSISAPECIN